MKKSKLIGTCLLNSGMVTSLTHGEDSVRDVFMIEFPNHDYSLWDTEIETTFGEEMIQAVGTASKVDVRKFIQDLW